MGSKSLQGYSYNGAYSLVLLYVKHLKSCLKTWQEAKSLGINLPKTDD